MVRKIAAESGDGVAMNTAAAREGFGAGKRAAMALRRRGCNGWAWIVTRADPVGDGGLSDGEVVIGVIGC
ncbi:hypothetical protein M0R45_008973 [Rubus argutus]